jgi:hypothetical protein
MDTGICIEDVIQTLIDLRLAHTGQSGNEIRNRRRQKSNTDNNNNNLDCTSVLTIDEDALRTAYHRFSTSNLASQNIFDPTCLRLISRR